MEQFSHYMQLPREVLIGRGAIDTVSDMCKQLGLKSPVVILTGLKTYDVAGKRVITSLEKLGYKTSFLLVKESTMKQVSDLTNMIKEAGANFILGIGGGKVIDVAKFTSFLVNVPFISVPTAASHDGISSNRVSISDSDKVFSIMAQAPYGIIADTSLVAQSPYRLTASGCGDIIAKYTAIYDWELAHKTNGEYYGEYASNLALMSAKLVMKNAELIRQNTERSIRIVLEALLSCGVAMSIAGSSRPCSGSEHLFSHALDMISPNTALHGEKCGIGAIMMAYLQKRNWRMIKEKLEIIGAPVNAKEIGVEPEHIIDALLHANNVRSERYTILGRNGLTRITAENLAAEVGIID